MKQPERNIVRLGWLAWLEAIEELANTDDKESWEDADDLTRYLLQEA